MERYGSQFNANSETTKEYGGINIRLERKHDQKQFQCELCDFRANLKCDISHHNRREHTDYMLVCEHCGYTTNNSSNLNRHARAKHAKYLL